MLGKVGHETSYWFPYENVREGREGDMGVIQLKARTPRISNNARSQEEARRESCLGSP
jgi:hypothetical protein